MTPGGSESDQDRTILTTPRGNATLGPGTKILNDTYVIDRCLGKGGMGEVYEAEHIELGSKRAIKIILPEYAKNTQYVALFIEEARKLSRVNNDAVVRYFEFSRDESGARYLVMEFVDGQSLSGVLEQRCLTPSEVIELIVRLGQGLAAVYDQGIKAHRDISPGNILLPQGRVGLAKVIDFGIAKSGDAGMTLIGSDFAGKYSYVSPEQVGLFGGPEQVDEKSDIYSLGLLAAAAAIGFGKRLDMGSEPASVTIARQKVPDLSGIPAELRPLLTHMLQPRPEDRPASMRALIEEAKQLGPQVPKPARAAPPASRRRFPVWKVGSGLVGLAAIAGVAAFLMWPKPPPTPTQPGGKSTSSAETASLKPQVLQPTQPAAPATPDPTEAARAELNDAMKTLDCATLRSENLSNGGSRIFGHVASADDQAKLLAIVDKLPADQRPEVRVEIVPPPLCRLIREFGSLKTDGLLDSGGVELKMARGVALHTGDPITVDVVSLSSYPMNLRIDYFTLTGDVLHMWPNAYSPTATLAPGETKKFLTIGSGNKAWQVGGAPFGTEYITVIATAQPLSGDIATRAVEPAADYLGRLRDALRRAPAPAGQPNYFSTAYIHTAAK